MKLSKTETSVLYFDRDTCSVSIYDSNSRKLWNSLPSSYRGGAPAVLAVEAAAPDGRIYTFNSQDDSVAKGTAKYETGNGFVSVAYSFTKALDGGGKISITVPVSFAVKGGVLTASVDCSKIQQSGAKVKTIRLLEYFGSSFGGKKGESLLVPDGCGAMIDASAANKPIAPAKVPVYGADYAARENASAYSAKAAWLRHKIG